MKIPAVSQVFPPEGFKGRAESSAGTQVPYKSKEILNEGATYEGQVLETDSKNKEVQAPQSCSKVDVRTGVFSCRC